MRTVRAPDGVTWHVKRHWISRRPRWRGREAGDFLDVGELFSFLDDSPVGILLGIVFLIAAVFFFTGFLALIVEALIVGVGIAVTFAAKLLFRRPWFVEATSEGRSEHVRRWAVVGWRRSGEIVDEVARSIEAGTTFMSADARELEGAVKSAT